MYSLAQSHNGVHMFEMIEVRVEVQKKGSSRKTDLVLIDLLPSKEFLYFLQPKR